MGGRQKCDEKPPPEACVIYTVTTCAAWAGEACRSSMRNKTLAAKAVECSRRQRTAIMVDDERGLMKVFFTFRLWCWWGEGIFSELIGIRYHHIFFLSLILLLVNFEAVETLLISSSILQFFSLYTANTDSDHDISVFLLHISSKDFIKFGMVIFIIKGLNISCTHPLQLGVMECLYPLFFDRL